MENCHEQAQYRVYFIGEPVAYLCARHATRLAGFHGYDLVELAEYDKDYRCDFGEVSQ